MASDAKTLLTAKQAAGLLGVSLDWLSRHRAFDKYAGDGPTWYKVGKKVLYDRNDVLVYLEKCKQTWPRNDVPDLRNLPNRIPGKPAAGKTGTLNFR